MKHSTKTLLSCVLTVVTAFAFSQNEAQKWYFGTNAGLDFVTSPPTVLTNGMLVTNEGCATISDGAGNLLFYTDGSKIYDKTHAIMLNGTGLTGNPSTTQSGIIVKQPGSSTIYYVFSLGASGTGSLCFSTVDLTLAGGLGAVTVKNTLLSATMSEKLTSVPHCNGKDIWVLAHANNSTAFHAYLVTSTGVNITPVITNIGTAYGSGTTWLGNMKASPNGRKLGLAIHGQTGNFEIYDFDNATGVISNSLVLGTAQTTPTYFPNAYGCEFSPDGSKFYGDTESGASTSKLFQWDLCAGSPTAIIASQYVDTVPSQLMGMQLATNGKIYVSRSGKDTLAVIHNPNAIGAACNYVHSGQPLAPKKSTLNLPNFMTGFFKPVPQPFTYTVSCNVASFDSPSVTNTLNAGCGAVVVTPTNVLWNFGDPASGAANSSTLNSPTHTYPGLGTYTVQMIAYNACSSDTMRIPVTVANAAPTLSIAGTFTVCKGEKRIYTVSGASSYTWHTTGVNTTTISLTTPTITTTYSVSGVLSGTNSCVSKKTFTLTVAKCTGIESATEADQSFVFYPNPSDGKISVESSYDVRIRILDKSGIIVLERSLESGNHDLDISSFSNGIYSIQCFTKKGVTTKRLVKID